MRGPVWRGAVVAACLGATAHGIDGGLLDIPADVVERFNDFGYSRVAVGDLDEDGVPDLALGVPSQRGNAGTTRGAVSVRSGATGAELFRMFPAPGTDVIDWGLALTLVGDLDGDGRRELAVSNPGSAALGSPAGFVDLVSLATRAPIRRLQGTVLAGAFGVSVADLGDVDGDGVSDILVGESGNSVDRDGAAWVFSGATGTRLDDRSLFGDGAKGRLGSSVAALGDVDGDGVPDYAAGAPSANAKGFTPGGAVVLRSGRPGGWRVQVNGKISEKTGFPVGDALGSAVEGADLDGDGRRELLVGGMPVQVGGGSILEAGSVRAYRIARAKKAVSVTQIGVLPSPAGAKGFGTMLRTLPGADAAPGDEVAVGAFDSLFVYALGVATPRLIARVDGAPGDLIARTPPAVADLGREGSAQPDGTPDLVLGNLYARIYAVPLPSRTAALPVQLVRKLTFAKGPAAATKSAASLVLTVAKGKATLSFKYAKLADAAGHTLHLEDAPGAGSFRQIAALTGVTGKLTLAGTGALPEVLATTEAALLAGRRVELRDSAGAVVLTARFPYAAEPAKGRLPRAFTAEPSGPFPNVKVTALSTTDVRNGNVTFSLAARGVPKGTALSLWGETSPGSGAFAKIADLSGTKLHLDLRKSFFPNFPPVDPVTLLARLLQLRDGSGSVVSSAPIAIPAGPAPDLAVPKVSLRFVEALDSFVVRADLRNLGAVAAGTLAVSARVTFTSDVPSSVPIVRDLATRTNVTFPVGALHEDVVLGTLDNPFAGEHPAVEIVVTVDPAPSGGFGEYPEGDETNNTRTAVYTWQLDTNDPSVPEDDEYSYRRL